MLTLPADVERAVEASLLGRFPAAARDRVLAEAVPVVSGLLRIYMGFPDGRQLTLRYARIGEFLGSTAVVAGPLPVDVQVVTEARVLIFNVQTLQHLTRTDPEVAWAIAQDVTQLLFTLAHIMAGTTLGTLRQRVARHLLDLAGAQAAESGSSLLVAHMTQQELADGVGSVREAVARVLKDLRESGVVRTTPGGIAIVDPERLQREASPE